MEWSKLFHIITPLLILFLCFFTGSSSEPGAVHFLRGYEKWVKKEVDVPAIRQWLILLPQEYSDTHYFEASEFPETLPKAIKNLAPYHMNLSEFNDGQRQVEFEWGSALGHWGIRIGLPEMEIPQDEECIKFSESEWEYRRPVQSGVYIFDRG